jgi:phenylalanyl-tRNA synthetase alpha chain
MNAVPTNTTPASPTAGVPQPAAAAPTPAAPEPAVSPPAAPELAVSESAASGPAVPGLAVSAPAVAGPVALTSAAPELAVSGSAVAGPVALTSAAPELAVSGSAVAGPVALTPGELGDALAIRDLSDPAAGPHAVQLVVDELRAALTGAWQVPARIRRGHPVVELADNYDRLGYAADAVTRDSRYTRYVDAGHVLRSHSSAMIPPALRELSADHYRPDDVLLVCPGICYRRDSVDWQHTGTPQQLDLWRIAHTACDGDDLLAMIGLVVDTVLPGARWRANPAEHPYTVGGREIEVLWRGQWVEIGECGVAAPHVLRLAGLDDGWSGLAMGLGLDRLVMLRKGVPDVRLLRSDDPRVANQLRDLAPYKAVSHMPPVKRDLSLVVEGGDDLSAEVLGDRVRAALGAEADAAELVEPLAVTPYGELPAAARERLGIGAGQVNLLLRLVLRPLDRTLTDTEANVLRDRVYTALHRGPVAELAAQK